MAKKYLRDMFFDVNGVNGLGMTKLQSAIRRDDVNRVLSLLDAGADVNFTDTVLQYRPLTQALVEGKPEMVNALIGHKSKINFDTNIVGQKRQRHSALSLLASNELPDIFKPMREELIKVALKMGADPFYNLRKHPGEDTPFHVAVRSGNADVVKLFCDHNPRALTRYFDGSTPALYAIEQGSPECLKIILEASPLIVHIRGANRKNPLLLDAVRSKNPKILDVVLGSSNMFVNTVNPEDDTALHLLVKSQMPVATRDVMIEKLLAKGADASLKNKKGETPLHILARSAIYTDAGAFETLADSLKNPRRTFEEIDHTGSTVLFTAAVFGSKSVNAGGQPLQDSLEIVDYLLDAGANPNAKDPRGFTALDRLAEQGDRTSPIVQRLLIGGGEYCKLLPPADFEQQKKGGLGKIQSRPQSGGGKKKKADGFKF